MASGNPVHGAQARSIGLGARSQLHRQDRAGASERIARRLSGLTEFDGPGHVAGYWPVPGEVDLRGFWHQLHDAGVTVCLPRIDPTGSRSMEFRRWHPDCTMTDNRYGIPEPDGEPVSLECLDVVVLPCVALDDLGSRVGMGQGFYDRTLAGLAGLAPGRGPGHRPTTLIGVAFEVQRLRAPDVIVREDWDVPLDVVVTESAVLRPGA